MMVAPRVGILMRTSLVQKLANNLNANGSWAFLFYMAQVYGIECFAFTSKDIDLKRNTVNGFFFEHQGVTRRIVPIPPVVDNLLSGNATNTKTIKSLAQKTHFTRSSEIYDMGKWGQYKLLSAHESFSKVAIPTLLLDAQPGIGYLINHLGDELILKPEIGSTKGGAGVIKIKALSDNQYEIYKDNAETQCLNKVEIQSQIDMLVSHHYIAQSSVKSVTDSGYPFEFKIYILRKNSSDFDYFITTRVGKKGAFSSMPTIRRPLAGEFIQDNFGSHSKKVLLALEKFAKTFPIYLQAHLKKPFCELVLDVGIEKEKNAYQIKLFEIDTLPNTLSPRAGLHLHMKCVRAKLEYYQYLHDTIAMKDG